MKKVLFLMFLLLLCLVTVNVKAQVRIGGNAAPNASAVLDLNADDTNSGNKGLALPRVGLTSNQMLLPGVTQNLTGMLVYNTSTTGTGVNTIGIYYWNGASWVKASLPYTSQADSGKFLVSTGSGWSTAYPFSPFRRSDTLTTSPIAQTPVTWAKIADATVTIDKDITPGSIVTIAMTNVASNDLCLKSSNGFAMNQLVPWNGYIFLFNIFEAMPKGTILAIRCYRPSA